MLPYSSSVRKLKLAATWLLALAALLAMALPVAESIYQLQPPNSAANSTGPNPYWRRPGCYRVGHTRTISIPGCVKFNLTTNACRGYCMSYSIPASEELAGPSSQPALESNLLQGADLLQAVSPTRSSADYPETHDRQASEDSLAGQRGRFNQLIRGHLQHSSTGQAGLNFGPDQQQSGERRDVVSVSQCCNMMETEDVVVNLRCGANEIRRLIFKSAKTCECFFCKHV